MLFFVMVWIGNFETIFSIYIRIQQMNKGTEDHGSQVFQLLEKVVLYICKKRLQ